MGLDEYDPALARRERMARRSRARRIAVMITVLPIALLCMCVIAWDGACERIRAYRNQTKDDSPPAKSSPKRR